MIDSTIPYRLVFESMRLNNLGNKDLPKIEPAEWDELGHHSEFLGSFVVSARNSPTIHLVVPRIVLISERIGVLAEHCNRVIRLAAATMQAKFDKYFADIPPIMIIANVLDPRCKLDFLRDVLGLGDQALQHTE